MKNCLEEEVASLSETDGGLDCMVVDSRPSIMFGIHLFSVLSRHRLDFWPSFCC